MSIRSASSSTVDDRAPVIRPPTSGVAVRARRVCAARGGRQVLADVDAAFVVGQVSVVTGPNGAGKSTLLEVLAGVLPVTSGTVDRTAPVHVFVPQRAAVPDRLPVTVRDVVTMGTWGRGGGTAWWRRVDTGGRRRVDDAIDALDLVALARRPFASLSGGERQRALLAQGLARDADLLFLDEPTTGLDGASAALICKSIVNEAARGVAVVCVSHDAAVVGMADHVVQLDHGRVVDDGGTTSAADVAGPRGRPSGQAGQPV